MMAPTTAVLFDNFGPYHFTRAAAAARLLKVVGVEMAASSTEYDWERTSETPRVPIRTLFGSANDDRGRGGVERRLFSTLDSIDPVAVAVPGWATPMAFAAVRWCVRRSIPAIVMSESAAWDARRRPLQEAMKRQLVGLFSAGLVGGQLHAAYLNDLGMPRERIFDGYDVVDNDYFASRAAAIRNSPSAIRGSLGLPENYFLASARFVEKKNLFNLLRGYAAYREGQAAPWSLVLLGDGPLKTDLEKLIRELGLREHVHTPGFKQYNELPSYYALAQCFVHASTTEQWGLVVNEAMASGLPVLVSRRCGCVTDLIAEGENGWTFDPDDVAQLTNLMVQITQLPRDVRAQMAQASERRIRAFSPERFATGLKNAVEAAIAAGPRRATILQRVVLSSLMNLERG